MSSTSNWLVDDSREAGKFSYEINICRALVTSPNQSCSPLSAGCQVIDGGQNFNLGFPSNPVYNNNTDSLFVTYTGGSACHNNSFNRSAIIEFRCAKSKSGAPISGSLVSVFYI